MHPDFAGIEHGDAENIAILRGAGADDLGEEGTPMPMRSRVLPALKSARFFCCSARSAW
jgi:hypothetical protein